MEEKDILDDFFRNDEKGEIIKSDFKTAAKLLAVAMTILGIEIILFIIIMYFGLDNDYITIAFMLLGLAFCGYLIAGVFYGIKGVILKLLW